MWNGAATVMSGEESPPGPEPRPRPPRPVPPNLPPGSPPNPEPRPRPPAGSSSEAIR
jgi:hypothetical protein